MCKSNLRNRDERIESLEMMLTLMQSNLKSVTEEYEKQIDELNAKLRPRKRKNYNRI
jgi:hypothetical protein